MFSNEQIGLHLKLIQSALRFKNCGQEILDMWMSGVNHDEKLGKVIHYENGKTADWTCYFTNAKADWVFATIHPLPLEEILPLYYAESYHDECEAHYDDKPKSSLMVLMIGDKFVTALPVCPELIAFAVERYHEKNVYQHDTFSELWTDEQESTQFQQRLDILKEYADGNKNPKTIKLP